MGENLTINVNLSAKCFECGKGGAMDSGICLACLNRMMRGRPMKTERGRQAAARVAAAIKSERARP